MILSEQPDKGAAAALNGDVIKSCPGQLLSQGEQKTKADCLPLRF